MEECIDGWQQLCPLGIHPHPVDPQFARTPTPLVRTPTPDAPRFVNTSPRKRAAHAAPVTPREDKTQVLADLKRYASPLPSASTSRTASVCRSHVNFAIRGDGIVSSSPCVGVFVVLNFADLYALGCALNSATSRCSAVARSPICW